MSEEAKPAEEAKPEEAAPKPEEAEAPKRPEWQYKTDFAVTGKMKEIVNKTIEASEKELVLLRRKLERLTYGS